MAKVEYAPIVSGVSGRFAGIVFSRWRGIPTLRRFVSPAQPRTADQLTTRRAFRVANGVWITLLQLAASEVQDSWRKAAVHPETDRNAFIAEVVKNRRTAQNLQSLSFLAPTRGTVLPTPTGAGAVSSGTLTATMAAYTTPTGYTDPTFEGLYIGPVDFATYTGAYIPGSYNAEDVPASGTTDVDLDDVATGGVAAVCVSAKNAGGVTEYSGSWFYTVS